LDKKLTIRLDVKVIERAKDYAKKNETSLSKLVEAYFDALTSGKEASLPATPLVEGLCGVVDLPEDYDHKSKRRAYIQTKHQ
jgi:hypothetical protein